MTTSLPTLLVVEDNPDDLFILRRVFKNAEIRNQIHYAEDGQQAIDYLQGTGSFSDRSAFPLPSLVLLDLKLPLKSGFDVLKWAKVQLNLKGVIFVILTSSIEKSDVMKAYDSGASAYVVKPTSVDKLTEIIRSLGAFWLKHNVFKTTV